MPSCPFIVNFSQLQVGTGVCNLDHTNLQDPWDEPLPMHLLSPAYLHN